MEAPAPLSDEAAATIIVLCRNLMMHYANAIDTRALREFANLFTEDGVFERPGAEPLRGRAQILEFLERLFAARSAGNPNGHLQRHLFTTMWIEPLALDRAAGISCALAYRDEAFTGHLPAPMRMPEMLVEYRTQFVRAAGRWQIRHHAASHLFRDLAG